MTFFPDHEADVSDAKLSAYQSGHSDAVLDISDRIDRAVTELDEMWRTCVAGTDESKRYLGKIEGLKLVKDWLRSYSKEES